MLTSVEGSIQLAESMEARGFGSGPRTALRSSPLRGADWWLIASSATALTLFVAARAAGRAADWQPYPALTLPPIDPISVVACLLLFAPVVAWRSRA